ncbi:UNVERIFIED_CONTAM: activating signal cointegrator 1 complex subunit [Siphonaria sp. JEL0065]|nr:activating signal cointegrator 1 complex subunit [Siphonaria sp. JEL0065]
MFAQKLRNRDKAIEAFTDFHKFWTKEVAAAFEKRCAESVVEDGLDETEEFGSDLAFVDPFKARKRGLDNVVEREDDEGGDEDSETEGEESEFDAFAKELQDQFDREHLDSVVPNASVAAGGSSGSSKTYDRDWLLKQCEVHLNQFADAEVLSPLALCTQIFTTLRGPQGDEEIQSDLFDSLGFGNMDFVSELLLHRKDIIANIVANSQSDPNTGKTSVGGLTTKNPYRPQYGAQVTVMSESEKQEMKKQRKEAKKRAKMTDGENTVAESANMLGFDVEHLKRAREEQLLMGASSTGISNPTVTRAPVIKYPHVYQSNDSNNSLLSQFATKSALPIGSTREEYQEYEEITIPVAKVAPQRANEALIPTASFEPWAQKAYKGYKSLNRVQSIVYPVAFETNENMLVCAPTGAGKTDVAMLTILRCIGQHRKHGFIMKNEFKIVYVAPMKALAAEVVSKFSKRLGGSEAEGGLGLIVKELTGDMQLTKAEIAATQMIVTTPEKWDVVTRKGTGDTELSQKVRLLIIDEVHLLHEDRGSVIESIVARTQRLVETSQSMIRIVGLSATLPNYVDVAQFLGVNPYQGLFYFDSGFRPVPLEQHFIGAKGRAGSASSKANMDRVCYEKLIQLVRDGHQVMVFVHSRKDTVKTAMMLRDEALSENLSGLFDSSHDPNYANAVKEMGKSRNKELKELFGAGFGIHHAGMLRSDRNMVEKFFEKGYMRVLCCTATLAWGVNLPAYAVLIKGTQLYDSQKGSFIDLSILDVLQIFGRAGRPQYEDRGVGYIITSHDKLSHYVSAMTMQHPIESRFASHLTDNLNAEISLGTVTTVDEAIKWLSYSYLFVRMRKNPFHYGLDWKDLEDDPNLGNRCGELVTLAARNLHKAQMIVFDERNGFLTPKDLCRISSSYYIRSATIEVFNEMMRPIMTEANVLSMLSMATEFENIKLREEEVIELKLMLKNSCPCDVKGGTDTPYGKTNILLQSYISRANVNDFALVSDCAYVAQNAARILRALFEICLSRNWGPTASVIISLCKSVDRRMWSFEHPLSQFDLPFDIVEKLNRSNMGIEELRFMDVKEIGGVVRHMKMGGTVAKCVEQFPALYLETEIAPITQSVIRITLHITPDFYWNDRVHGAVEPFWIWVEDSESVEILHSEYFLLTKKAALETQKLVFTIPIPRTNSTADELPPQIYVRALSDKWIGSETVEAVSFKHLILPSMKRSPHTDLLNLQPLPVSALQNPVLEEICLKRFDYFNPVQTQIFHTLYRTNNNALIGAPTGSGKTVAAELALWAAFRDFPKSKVVFIAPLKALVRERVQDWRARLTNQMSRRLVELTGDVTPDLRTIQDADIIITTPEKWDGISRNWQTRKYVTDVSLVIIDEIHLLGGDRGPILEVIVSRMNYISAQTNKKIRIVGLSTALANATDLGDWLHIENEGLFNFRHSVRPVPLEVYIDGFAGKHYCPRMMSMNKPTYSAILTHSPTKPVIVFVSSRRQTRLTAQDLIAYCALEDNPKRFLHMPEHDLETLVENVKDQSLKLSLQFGIGLHHAGLIEGDRKLSEELFVNGKIQILIATSTLAWGVNYPAHLVVVKGTEFYDAKTRGYVDFPITDVLQMMGRAGRPQFDDSGVARILVQDSKKNFYKKFLHEPFPVESSLHHCIHDHMNAEIVGGTIKSKQDAVDYLTWTYFYRRLQMNPTYYGVVDTSPEGIDLHLSNLIETTFNDLSSAFCIQIEQGFYLKPTVYGKIASYYYLSYKTVGLVMRRLTKDYKPVGDVEKGERLDGDFAHMLRILSDVPEFNELPVRHNEDKMNQTLEESLPVPVLIYWKPGMELFGGVPENLGFEDPHVKAFLLLQAHLTRVKALPCSDYGTDTTSVLDQSIRVMQAMVDIAADKGILGTCLGVVTMMQAIKQARWPSDSPLLTLPHVTDENVDALKTHKTKPITALTDLCKMSDLDVVRLFSTLPGVRSNHAQEIAGVVANLPTMQVHVSVEGSQNKNGVWEVDCGKEYELKVQLKRNRLPSNARGNKEFRIHSPKFPKAQVEGWFVVLGKEESDELIALKRVAGGGSGSTAGGNSNAAELRCSMKFSVAMDPGPMELVLFVNSDGYLGLDQKIKVRILGSFKA